MSCQEKHPLCRFEEAQLPTRVLDVQSRMADTTITLVDSEGLSARYATLSYCWGLSGNLKTTKANIQAHRNGIKIDTLPKTIREAVITAQHLSLRYLWVDALCIIQDDTEDWEQEAQRMARVYASAYINISALGAADTSNGCFMRRPADRGAVPLLYHLEDGTECKVFATIAYQLAMGTEKHDLSGYPASIRAWTLQERILARRTLHFAAEQMFFECAWGFQSEDGFLEHRGKIDDTPSTARLGGKPSIFVEGDMASTHFSGYEGWARLVNIYGTRLLTKSSDKLPAFSGIAQRYEEMLQDTFVAGLWKSRIIEDLHWSSESWYIPPDYRAPSWSWMSIDGPIHMPDMAGKNTGRKCATVLDYHLEVKGQNRYGEITAGWLKIEAPLEEVIDDRIFGFRPSEGNLRVMVEIPHDLFDKLRIFTLMLYTTGSIPWTALLITPVSGSGLGENCYRRVGKVTNLSWKKKGDMPKMATCVLI